jgi:dienelactone hydrolase
VLFLLTAQPVAAQNFTLEQVMSSPFPSDLTVSRRGDRVAWAFDAEGKRNIWVAEAPAFAPRQLTNYNSDDGQELSDLGFSPAANLIALVRGGDKKRVGLWGGSYGGYLAALGLARNSDMFAAGVDFHGVHDWSNPVAGLRVPTDTAERNRVARESSPISALDKWKSPVLLIHGDDDRNVEFSQTVNLVRRLRANGVYFEELIYPDEIHDFLRHQDWLRAYHAGAEFFDKHLK